MSSKWYGIVEEKNANFFENMLYIIHDIFLLININSNIRNFLIFNIINSNI